MQTNHRYTTLDGMRGLAALSVMLFHVTQSTRHHLFPGGSFAVDLFFCLSGFVMAHAYQGRLQSDMTFIDFAARRLIRLYPMLIIGTLIGAAALAVKIIRDQTDLSAAAALHATILNLLYLPYIGKFYVSMGGRKIGSAIFPSNDPAWSLSFELLANTFFGLFLAKFRKIPLGFIIFMGALGILYFFCIRYMAAPGWGRANIFGGIPRVFFSFFCGVYIFDVVRNKTFGPAPSIPSPFLLVVLFFFLWFGYASAWLLGALFISPALVYLGSASTPHMVRFSSLLDYLGWLSYPLYCVHFPIYSIFVSFFGSSYTTSAAAVLCSLIAAHFLARSVEEPVRRILTRIWQKRRPPLISESHGNPL